MTTTTDQLAALDDRVLGVARACAFCGVRSRTTETKVTADRLRGDGELVWSVCDECGPSFALGDLARVAVVDVLQIDPENRVIPSLLEHVAFFSDNLSSRPDRPNSTPWQHVDRSVLAEAVEHFRIDEERRKGGPCMFCGFSLTPPGTQWSGSGEKATCGGCARRLTIDGVRVVRAEERDRLAAAVVGFNRRGTVRSPLNLGAMVGLVYWSESGARSPNATPFGHSDVRAMRRKVAELAAQGYIKTPPKWKADEVGTVAW